MSSGPKQNPSAFTEVTRRLDAPPAVVYRALLDPRAIAIWMVPDGMTSRVHRFDSRVGGTFRISLTYAGDEGVGKSDARTDTYHGRIVELVPDERVVEVIEFETADPALQGAMTITYTLAPAGTGTELRARHADLPPGLSPADNRLGWELSLDKLARYVTTV